MVDYIGKTILKQNVTLMCQLFEEIYLSANSLKCTLTKSIWKPPYLSMEILFTKSGFISKYKAL